LNLRCAKRSRLKLAFWDSHILALKLDAEEAPGLLLFYEAG